MTIPAPTAHARERDALRHEQVVLVDQEDREVGTTSKLQAHRRGQLHRAVSVLVCDSKGAFLLQRRALQKYHSPGLWSNSCCGHPRPGEATLAAASRRLREEMGVDCPLEFALAFSYRAALGRGMTEHEIDHVFVGECDDAPSPDPLEVSEWRRVEPGVLQREMRATPELFTVWFHVLMERLAFRNASAPCKLVST